MNEYTFRNYLRWGYEADVPFSEPPEDPEQVRLWFDIDPAMRGFVFAGTIRQASMDTARHILNQADRANMPVSLSMSGGIDSEAMLVAFLLVCGSDRPFTCTILRFANGLNWHETSLAIRLCEQHGVQYDVIDLDVFELWYRLPAWMERFRLASGILYTSLYEYAARPETFFVRGGNPVLRVDKFDPSAIRFEMYSATTHAERYCRSVGRPGVPRFHLFSPHQLLAWLNHPIIQAWQRQLRGSGITSFNMLKPIIYQMEFPEISESRRKWTGSELLTNHIDDLWFRQWVKNLPFNPTARRPINEIIAELQH